MPTIDPRPKILKKFSRDGLPARSSPCRPSTPDQKFSKISLETTSRHVTWHCQQLNRPTFSEVTSRHVSQDFKVRVRPGVGHQPRIFKNFVSRSCHNTSLGLADHSTGQLFHGSPAVTPAKISKGEGTGSLILAENFQKFCLEMTF